MKKLKSTLALLWNLVESLIILVESTIIIGGFVMLVIRMGGFYNLGTCFIHNLF